MIEVTMKRLYQFGVFCFGVGAVCQAFLLNTSSFWSILLGCLNILFSLVITGFFYTELKKMIVSEGSVLSEEEIKKMFNQP